MKISGKKRDILIIISALAVILVISALFLFWPKNKSQKENQEGPGDFSINGNVIENKKEGLTVIVPDGWQTNIPEQTFESEWGVHIFSPSAEVMKYASPDSYLMKSGCFISVNVEKSKTFFNAINSYLGNVGEGTKFSSFDDENITGVIKIDSRLAWKELSFDKNDLGKRLEIRIPLQNDKLIYFAFISSESDKMNCFEEFNRFIENISIY